MKFQYFSFFFFKGIFKDKSKYRTLTRMSYCQCRLRLVFSSIFKEFGWSHVALILDRSDLFSWTVGKNLEYGLRKEGLLKFVRELDGNFEDESYHFYLRDASMYARGKCPKIYFNFVVIHLNIHHSIMNVYNKINFMLDIS